MTAFMTIPLSAAYAGLTYTVRGAKYSTTTTRMPGPMASPASAAWARKASVPPRTGSITSPVRPGPMPPVTRPTLPTTL